MTHKSLDSYIVVNSDAGPRPIEGVIFAWTQLPQNIKDAVATYVGYKWRNDSIFRVTINDEVIGDPKHPHFAAKIALKTYFDPFFPSYDEDEEEGPTFLVNVCW